ncbi:MAG: signal peptidase I [Alphaproteobacteria bacterium]|nr:signal peptidase I [Alphaproteobacteria bacterium]
MSKFKKSIISNLKALFWALIIAGFIRSFIVEPFKIPSGSMKPNLLVGDFLFVSKWDYGYSRYSFPFGLPLFDGKLLEKSPKRGDIIVFKLPTKESINYVKRLVAMPGETIKISEGMIYVKKKGDNVFKMYSQKLMEPFFDDQYNADIIRLQENNTNRNYEILNLSNNSMLDNTNEFLVPNGHYFFMGDNRDNSSDSRDTRNTVGFVPKENIIGKVRFIFLSIDTQFKLIKIYSIFNHLRYERFFKKII